MNFHKIILIAAVLISFNSCSQESSSGSNDTSTNAINGSYTKILVVGNYLYGIKGNELSTVDIKDKQNTHVVHTQELSFDIESIFHNNGILFIGSSSRLYIYSISHNGVPEQKSVTNYSNFDNTITFCDPVVADDKNAYVTLSGELTGECNRNFEVRELRIYNIENIENPYLISTTEMHNPKGLGIDGSTLFVCDDTNGLVIFDVSNKENPIELYHFSGFQAYDLIPNDGILLVVAKDQLLQYDYSNLSDIRLLSSIDL